MATSARSGGLFSGLVLIFAGVLVLLYNCGHLDLGGFLSRWWPLLIIFWGAVKLYERTAGRRLGGIDGSRASGSDGGLVLVVVAVVAIVVLAKRVPDFPPDVFDVGDIHTFDM